MICYNEFRIKSAEANVGNELRINKCEHNLGEECLKMWFENSNSCQCCRDKSSGTQKNRAKHYSCG